MSSEKTVRVERKPVVTLCVAAVCLGAAFSEPERSEPAKARPDFAPDAVVLVVGVVGLTTADLEARHPDGTPVMPGLRALADRSILWTDALPAAVGSAGLWSLWTGQDPRVALRADAPPVDRALAEGWETRLLRMPGTLRSDPEWNSTRPTLERAGVEDLPLVRASPTLLLAAFEPLADPRPIEDSQLLALDPRPWEVPGGLDRAEEWPRARLQMCRRALAALRARESDTEPDRSAIRWARRAQLARTDAELSGLLRRLDSEAGSRLHVVVAGVPSSPPRSATQMPDAPSWRGRRTFSVPLLWSHAEGATTRIQTPVTQLQLRPTLEGLADREAAAATLFAPAGADAPTRYVLWWNDHVGGVWWEEGPVAMALQGADGRALYDLVADRRGLVDVAAAEPHLADRTLDRIRASLGLEAAAWTIWAKGSAELDFLELEIETAALDSFSALALEEIDELRRTAPGRCSLSVAAEPEGDGLILYPVNPPGDLRVRIDGAIAEVPLLGAPLYVGPHARPAGLSKRRLATFSRVWWSAWDPRPRPAAETLPDEAPAGIHLRWGPPAP